MAKFPFPHYVCAIVMLSLGLGGGCGGTSGTGPGNPTPTPNISVTLSSSTISLAPGGTGSVTVTFAVVSAFAGNVEFTVSGLPATVTVTPSSLNLPVGGNGGTFLFNASANAPASQTSINIRGTAGSQIVDTPASLVITNPVAASSSLFRVLGGEAERAFYDEARQLLFVTNRNLNEVDVLSGSTLAVQNRVSVPVPYGIDQMADGHTLVVGTLTQGIYTVDEDTLAVTAHLAPNQPTNTFSNNTTVFPNPVALANGKVLLTAGDSGFPSVDFAFGGTELIEWDSVAGTFTELMSEGQNGAGFSVGNLKRSADHKWAIFSTAQMNIYSSDADMFTSSFGPVTDAQPYNVRDVAANPDGTQFAVASAQEVSFYDRSFNRLGTVSTNVGILQDTNAQYSFDGKRFYWGMYAPYVDVVDPVNFVEVGNVTTYFGSGRTEFGSLTPNSFLWIDAKQRIFVSSSGGVGVADGASPNTQQPQANQLGVGRPFALGLNTLTPVSFPNSFQPPGTTVSVGGISSAVQFGNPFIVVPPVSSSAGPADIAVKTPDGRVFVSPQALSYGVSVSAASATLLPPNGNPVITVSGFGLYNDSFTGGAVSVGGKPAPVVGANAGGGIVNALQQLTVQIPNGSPGAADLTVASNQGTGTLSGALSYIPSANILPTAGLVQLLYDTKRNVLYALKSTEVDVLNSSTLQWQTPIFPGGSPGSGYVSMTLTPDGSRLLLADSMTSLLTAVNPDNPSQKTDIALPSAPAGNIVATNTGKVFVGGTNVEVDLASQTASLKFGLPAEYAATPDGTHVVGAEFGNSAGGVYVWDSASDTFTSQGFVESFFTDVAIANDGTTFAALSGLPGFGGVNIGFFDAQLHYLNTNVYPDLVQPQATEVLGAIYTPSGKTLVVPSGDSFDFFDVRTGTLKGRLMSPEPLVELNFPDVTRGNVALDPSGQTIFSISKSGLTVMQLSAPIDQATPPLWPQAVKADAAALGIGKAALRRAHLSEKSRPSTDKRQELRMGECSLTP